MRRIVIALAFALLAAILGRARLDIGASDFGEEISAEGAFDLLNDALKLRTEIEIVHGGRGFDIPRMRKEGAVGARVELCDRADVGFVIKVFYRSFFGDEVTLRVDAFFESFLLQLYRACLLGVRSRRRNKADHYGRSEGCRQKAEKLSEHVFIYYAHIAVLSAKKSAGAMPMYS